MRFPEEQQHSGPPLSRPKIKAEELPAITPFLRRMGVHHWCNEEFPELDCTNKPRVRGPIGNDAQRIKHRLMLCKIANTLHQHYLELRVKDIAFIMGYSQEVLYKIMDFEPPEDF